MNLYASNSIMHDNNNIASSDAITKQLCSLSRCDTSPSPRSKRQCTGKSAVGLHQTNVGRIADSTQATTTNGLYWTR